MTHVTNIISTPQFILTPRFPYVTSIDCSCSSCLFNLSFRLNCKPIVYRDLNCYPIFPCLEKNHCMYDYDYLSDLDWCFLVLLNCTLTDTGYELLQRGIRGFYHAFESVVNQHRIMEYNDFLPEEGAQSIHNRIQLFKSTTVVIDSTSIAYNQMPRFEHGKPLVYDCCCSNNIDDHIGNLPSDQSDEEFPNIQPISGVILKEQNTWLALHYPEARKKKVKEKINWRSPVADLRERRSNFKPP